MIDLARQSGADESEAVSTSKLCQWFDIARRSACYRSQLGAPRDQPCSAEPTKAMIEENPSFGYQTVAHLLNLNKNMLQRIFQLKSWLVKKRPLGFRPRIEALPPVTKQPNERWSADLCRLWTGRDSSAVLNLVVDCNTRELLGWQISRSGKAKTAEMVLEQALITRFGTLGRVPIPFLLRSDNGLVFTSHSYTPLVRSYDIKQVFITPHCH
jgi:putative transposase